MFQPLQSYTNLCVSWYTRLVCINRYCIPYSCTNHYVPWGIRSVCSNHCGIPYSYTNPCIPWCTIDQYVLTTMVRVYDTFTPTLASWCTRSLYTNQNVPYRHTNPCRPGVLDQYVPTTCILYSYCTLTSAFRGVLDRYILTTLIYHYTNHFVPQYIPCSMY
jgi:hypothetical protein